MREITRIAPTRTEPGLIAYECAACTYVTSVIVPVGAGPDEFAALTETSEHHISSPDWLKFKKPMKTRTHFGYRIDMLDREGEILEHLAGAEDALLADLTYEAALKRWPKEAIILRQGARVIRDSRKPRLVK
jgi:hypothetical protein